MIKNEREHHITKTQLENFDQALTDTAQAGPPENVHPLLHAAQRDALQSQRDSLRQEVTDYEALKMGNGQAQFEQMTFERLHHLLPGIERITLTDEDLASVVLNSPE